MAIFKKVKGVAPTYGDKCWFAENAVVTGDVIMGENCNIWFGAVIRGDVHHIRMGNNVNVQDNVTVHATYKTHPTNIGNNVSIGHNAIVHGCTIEDNVLIGMGSIVMDGVVVKSNSLIAAGSVVTQGTVVESGVIYAGNPARKLKDISEKQIKEIVERIANDYPIYASWYDKE